MTSLLPRCKRGLLRQIGHSLKFSLVLLRYEPEVEVGRVLHQRQEIDALDPGSSLDRRDEPVQDRTELDPGPYYRIRDHQKAAGIVFVDTASVLFGVEGLQVTDAQALSRHPAVRLRGPVATG
jgi:hypothetical protein